MKFVHVVQDIEQLKKSYAAIRGINHSYKNNNWLKMHKEPMRRKPFRKEYMYLDEAYMLVNENFIGGVK